MTATGQILPVVLPYILRQEHGSQRCVFFHHLDNFLRIARALGWIDLKIHAPTPLILYISRKDLPESKVPKDRVLHYPSSPHWPLSYFHLRSHNRRNRCVLSASWLLQRSDGSENTLEFCRSNPRRAWSNCTHRRDWAPGVGILCPVSRCTAESDRRL